MWCNSSSLFHPPAVTIHPSVRLSSRFTYFCVLPYMGCGGYNANLPIFITMILLYTSTCTDCISVDNSSFLCLMSIINLAVTVCLLDQDFLLEHEAVSVADEMKALLLCAAETQQEDRCWNITHLKVVLGSQHFLKTKIQRKMKIVGAKSHYGNFVLERRRACLKSWAIKYAGLVTNKVMHRDNARMFYEADFWAVPSRVPFGSLHFLLPFLQRMSCHDCSELGSLQLIVSCMFCFDVSGNHLWWVQILLPVPQQPRGLCHRHADVQFRLSLHRTRWVESGDRWTHRDWGSQIMSCCVSLVCKR